MDNLPIEVKMIENSPVEVTVIADNAGIEVNIIENNPIEVIMESIR